MNQDIAKTIYIALRDRPPTRAVLIGDLSAAYNSLTGRSLSDEMESLAETANSLEEMGYVTAGRCGNGMPRISRGLHFDEWERAMNPSESKSTNIGSIEGNNVQVGDHNTQQINVTPQQIVDALEALVDKPEQSKSILDKLKYLAQTGGSVSAILGQLIGLTNIGDK